MINIYIAGFIKLNPKIIAYETFFIFISYQTKTVKKSKNDANRVKIEFFVLRFNDKKPTRERYAEEAENIKRENKMTRINISLFTLQQILLSNKRQRLLRV